MRAFLIILDGVGIGELPDADEYGDVGSNTIGNLACYFNGLKLPWFQKLGLGNLLNVKGVAPVKDPMASYGKMSLASPGKDTMTGHWEMTGIVLKRPFPIFSNGFPQEIISHFESLIGRPTLGNKAASGTEIIKELGKEHISTGYPIVYTSADSVFQLAAHEDIVPLETLYKWCKIAREKVFVGKYQLGRVIARPFKGESGNFYRTNNRKDFAVKPPADNLLVFLARKGHNVVSIGKIYDIFSGEGITAHYPASGNENVMKEIVNALAQVDEGLVFANLNDFDTLYGHRNDPEGFYKALKHFDGYIPLLYDLLQESDVLIISADHGCDPTFVGTDHTREFVPLFVLSPSLARISLGWRKTYCDVAQSIAQWFGYMNFNSGSNFLPS